MFAKLLYSVEDISCYKSDMYIVRILENARAMTVERVLILDFLLVDALENFHCSEPLPPEEWLT